MLPATRSIVGGAHAAAKYRNEGVGHSSFYDISLERIESC